MAFSCTAFQVMMLENYGRSFCPSRVINPYAGRNVGLWHKADLANFSARPAAPPECYVVGHCLWFSHGSAVRAVAFDTPSGIGPFWEEQRMSGEVPEIEDKPTAVSIMRELVEYLQDTIEALKRENVRKSQQRRIPQSSKEHRRTPHHRQANFSA